MLNRQRQVCAESYRGPVKLAVLLQVGMGILCVLTLGGGALARVSACAVLAYWAGAAWILVRRPFAPTRFDLEAIRYGFLPVFMIAIIWAQYAGFIR